MSSETKSDARDALIVIGGVFVVLFSGLLVYGSVVDTHDHEFRMACIEQGMTWIEERCE